MAVQIVSRPPERRVICKRCECELAYTKLDVKTHYPRIPEFNSYDYIDCPSCRFMVVIEHSPPTRR